MGDDIKQVINVTTFFDKNNLKLNKEYDIKLYNKNK